MCHMGSFVSAIAIAISFLAAAPAVASSPKDDYAKCLDTAVATLAREPEPAKDVAEALMNWCWREEAAAQAASGLNLIDWELIIAGLKRHEIGAIIQERARRRSSGH